MQLRRVLAAHEASWSSCTIQHNSPNHVIMSTSMEWE